MRHTHSIEMAVVAALALALGACGSSGTPSTSASSTDRPGPSAEQIGIATENCTWDDSQTTNPKTGDCTFDASDTRLSGSVHLAYNNTTDAQGRTTLWGTWALTNGGGTWACQVSGILDVNTMAETDSACLGRDGYEGLVAYEHATTLDTHSWGLITWVEPAP